MTLRRHSTQKKRDLTVGQDRNNVRKTDSQDSAVARRPLCPADEAKHAIPERATYNESGAEAEYCEHHATEFGHTPYR